MPAAVCSAAGMETVAEIVIPSLDSRYSAKDQAETPQRVEHIEGFFDCGPREVHPWQRAAMPSQEKLQASAHYPVLVTPNPMAPSQVLRIRSRSHRSCRPFDTGSSSSLTTTT